MKKLVKNPTNLIKALLVLLLQVTCEANANKISTVTTVGDMIPQLSAVSGWRIHIDNTLHGVACAPLPENPKFLDCLAWAYGFTKSNDLRLETDKGHFYIKGRDFSRNQMILQGPLRDGFREGASAMGWRLISVGGQTVIQYPEGHHEIVQQLIDVEQKVAAYSVNISVFNSEIGKRTGFDMAGFLSFQLSNFDLLHNQPNTLVTLPSLAYDNLDITEIYTNTVTAKVSGLLGQPVRQSIDTTQHILTTSRDSLAQSVAQQVQQFTFGTTLTFESFPMKEGYLLNLKIEISEDLSAGESELPRIGRRRIEASNIMTQGEVWLAAQFQNSTNETYKRKRFGFRAGENATGNEIIIVTIKRTE